jgi:hypothetical protein
LAKKQENSNMKLTPEYEIRVRKVCESDEFFTVTVVKHGFTDKSGHEPTIMTFSPFVIVTLEHVQEEVIKWMDWRVKSGLPL